MSKGLHGLRSGIRRFAGGKRAGVAIIFALSLLPLTLLIGMAVDYSRASLRKVQLNAAADSAALSAVTPPMLSQSDQALSNRATSVFNAEVQNIPGITYNPATLTVSVSDSGLSRTVTVSYQAASQNAFATLLGMQTISFTGTSQATSSVPPNIDFYLLLDNSPSMSIAATTVGINTMVASTPDKCAFGCHESDLSPNDYYGLARSLNVTLRMDLVTQATANLMTTAQQTMKANNNKYRVAIYTFNIAFNTIAPLTSNLGGAQSAANNITLYEVPYQNWSNDAITNYDTAMSSINNIMPNPGNGTNANGDKPQEVMFFVTDGVEDEMVGGNRQQSLMDNGWCSTIKNRGIRIAVLYTEYLPLPLTNYPPPLTPSWYATHISSFQAQIGPNLQACASPGLYFKVTTDGDISGAMNTLFQEAVATAHLTE
jgi:Flp pilus assembly protein TadG